MLDILALLEVFFDVGSLFSRRVTVKDRYEMKKRVRELRRREQLQQRDDARQKQRS